MYWHRINVITDIHVMAALRAEIVAALREAQRHIWALSNLSKLIINSKCGRNFHDVNDLKRHEVVQILSVEETFMM